MYAHIYGIIVYILFISCLVHRSIHCEHISRIGHTFLRHLNIQCNIREFSFFPTWNLKVLSHHPSRVKNPQSSKKFNIQLNIEVSTCSVSRESLVMTKNYITAFNGHINFPVHLRYKCKFNIICYNMHLFSKWPYPANDSAELGRTIMDREWSIVTRYPNISVNHHRHLVCGGGQLCKNKTTHSAASGVYCLERTMHMRTLSKAKLEGVLWLVYNTSPHKRTLFC